MTPARRDEDAMLDAGAAVLRTASMSDLRALALQVWQAMDAARPRKPGPKPRIPGAFEQAMAERLAGKSVAGLVRKYRLSGSNAQRLRNAGKETP